MAKPRDAQHATADEPLTAWIDGGCDLCRSTSRWVEARDQAAAVTFRDFRGLADTDLPRSRAEHEECIWVRDSDGELHGGYDAVLRLLAELPGWRILARVGSWWPLRRVGDRVYALVASHRV